MQEKVLLDKSSPIYKENVFYKEILAATIPLVLLATYLYGIRPILLVLVAMGTARVCDWLAATLQGKKWEKREINSIASAVIFTLMLPATISFYIVIFGVAVFVLLAKHAFGGAHSYPFNLAAVGYAIVAVGWPQEVFKYPQPLQTLPLFSTEGVRMTEAASSVLKMGGLPNIGTMNLILGNYAGPMGATFVIVIIACALFLIARGHKFLYSSVAFISVTALIAFAFPRVYLASRFDVMRYEVLSGAFVYAAVFLLADPVTLPKNNLAKIVYGAILGFVTMMFHYFGTFELGVCFAMIIVNSFSDFIDRKMMALTKPKPKKTEGVAKKAEGVAK